MASSAKAVSSSCHYTDEDASLFVAAAVQDLPPGCINATDNNGHTIYWKEGIGVSQWSFPAAESAIVAAQVAGEEHARQATAVKQGAEAKQ